MNPITESLLAWYDRCARVLPWRGIHDPYRTWVSEAMLQQTRVETVLNYYGRFLARFPSLRDLAEAPEEDVLKLWEGLGYYSRARNLHQGAGQVMRDYQGVLPSDPALLRKIKGIGPYTACAIASIAYGVPVPAVDGNVIRVISRLFLLPDNPLEPGPRRRIEELAEALVPADRPGDHNQAMMDLGATVCVPGTPDCGACPVAAFCRARAEGDPAELPNLPQARPPRIISYDVPVIAAENRVLVYRRKEKMLQGLWCFPLLEGSRTAEQLKREIEKKTGLRVELPGFQAPARHVFTHQVWEMKIWLCQALPGAAPSPDFSLISRADLERLPFPTAMKAPRAAALDLLA